MDESDNGFINTMAKVFRFRLQHVLHLKEYAVEQAKIALGEVVILREKIEQDIVHKEQYLDEHFTKNNGNTAADLQMHFQHRLFTQEEIKLLQKQLVNIKEHETIRRRELNVKMQDKKVIENLRDRQKEIFIKETLREEQIFMDEIANGAVIRKNKIELHRKQ